MDADQLNRLLTTIGDSSTATRDTIRDFAAAASADREASTLAMARLTGAIARNSQGGSRRHEPIRLETVNQVLKTEKDAYVWAKENPFDPVKNSAELWGADVSEKLVSTHSHEVIKWGGYEAYKRQSNDLFDFEQKTDQTIATVLEESYSQHWGNQSCRGATHSTMLAGPDPPTEAEQT